jgi:tetratricopeptide (TPR) repeat protein
MMLMQANTAYNQGNYEQAIDLYKKMISIDQDNPDHHYRLGLAYFSKGEKYQAQRKANRLRKMNRTDLAESLEQLLTQMTEHLTEEAQQK